MPFDVSRIGLGVTQQGDLAAALAQAALEISEPVGLQSTLDAIVRVALKSMPGIDAVGIALADAHGGIECLAVTSQTAADFVELQYSQREGPCWQTISTGEPVKVQNLDAESRWPQFIPQAHQMGLRSQLAIPVQARDSGQGALCMYSTSQDSIGEETEYMAELFATHASVALGNALRLKHLNAGLASRRVIGIALGVVMHRFKVGENAAFAYLTRVSATTETKLRTVAASIVSDHESQISAEAKVE